MLQRIPRINFMSVTTKKTGRRIAMAALIVAVLGALWWWFGKRAEPAVTYRTAKIERGALQAVVAATGTVNPVSQVQVGTQVSGQIRELMVDFNSEVKRDQLIARIDPETFEYRVRQATADLEAARASVLTAQANVQQALAQSSRAQVEQQEAQRDLERKQGLVAQNFISPAEADAARAKANTLAEAQKATQAQVAVARAQAQTAAATVKQREAQLAQARIDLERTQIRSPVDGIVIKRAVEVGQTVAASLQTPELFVIARNLSDMQVETSIDEADVSRVRLDQKATFTVDAFAGRTFEGAVKQVRKAAVSAQNVVTYVAVIGFTNTGGNLLPGMTANVRIVTDTRDNAQKVPNAALRVRIAGVEPEAGASAPAAQAAPGGAAAAGTAPADARPGGAMREFRERLVRELQLTAAQQEQVDSLMDGVRPQFVQLRDLPEEERGKARERVLTDLRARIAQQLTPAQQPKYQQLLAELGARQTTRARIFMLADDGKPRAFDVRLGITDGVMTELLVPPGSSAAQALAQGASVITGVVGAQSASGSSGQRPQTMGPRLPF
jgi:HlyD family secretion protein